MKHLYFVINFIVRRTTAGDEFLMARREDGKYMGGTWQLISGRIEPDEIAWQAALREILEEVNLRVMELYRLSNTSTFYRPDNNSLCTGIPFLAIVASDAEVTLNNENTDYRWIKREAMPAQLMWPDDRLDFAEACTLILDDSPVKKHLSIEIEAD